jgi:hypothetical protein
MLEVSYRAAGKNRRISAMDTIRSEIFLTSIKPSVANLHWTRSVSNTIGAPTIP